MWTMCGVVCILLYYVLYQSSFWLPDFDKLFVLPDVRETYLLSGPVDCVRYRKRNMELMAVQWKTLD